MGRREDAGKVVLPTPPLPDTSARLRIMPCTLTGPTGPDHLGASDMRFTPGWAIGWYCVPVACFWRPYQAMTEIWRASRNPSDWRGEPVSPLLRWWWILWLVVHRMQMDHHRRQVAAS